jgi:hypothetical protein
MVMMALSSNLFAALVSNVYPLINTGIVPVVVVLLLSFLNSAPNHMRPLSNLLSMDPGA